MEAAIPTERSHVQLEVDDEPTVPEEPTASMPFVPRWRSIFFFFFLRFFVFMSFMGYIYIYHIDP